MISNRKILLVSGEDSTDFLQKITTNDIRNIKEQLQYHLILTPQGKLLHDVFILKTGENEFMLDCYGEAAEDIMSILYKYKLGAKVEVRLENEIFVGRAAVGYCDPRHPGLGHRSYSRQRIERAECDEAKIYYGMLLPRLYTDFESGKYFPFEVGFNKFNAISYDKGCYIGQEVITRTHFRGAVRKKIYQVMTKGYFVGHPDIYLHERKAGTLLLNLDGKYGLAILNSELIDPCQSLQLSSGEEVQVLQ